jgi:hypothetical protein
MAAAPKPQNAGEVLTVFILAGQSNMLGQGVTAELPAELQASRPAALFAKSTELEFKPLNPGKLGQTFGPEVSFGVEMARELKKNIGIIKLALGGTSLEKQWNPLEYDKEKHVGELYKRLIDEVHAIQAKRPNIKIAGMLWMQGEADSRYFAKTMEQYRDKLEALIDGCRKEFNSPDMVFVCGRINPPGWPHVKQVREAQETARRKRYTHIDLDALEKKKEDNLHFTTKGQIELGKLFAAAALKLMSEKPEAAPNNKTAK